MLYMWGVNCLKIQLVRNAYKLYLQTEGNRQIKRKFKYYNFQMVLVIGYRERSNVGMHFRNWASSVLTDYSKKGFAMNDERLKNPQAFGVDYFDEFLQEKQGEKIEKMMDNVIEENKEAFWSWESSIVGK